MAIVARAIDFIAGTFELLSVGLFVLLRNARAVANPGRTPVLRFVWF
jgi:hypothetical protein